MCIIIFALVICFFICLVHKIFSAAMSKLSYHMMQGHQVEGSSFHTLISHCPALNISHFNMRKLNWELGDYVLAH